MTKSRCSGVMLENGMYRVRSCFSPEAIVGAAMRCSLVLDGRLEAARSGRRALPTASSEDAGVPHAPSPAVVGLAIDLAPDSVHVESKRLHLGHVRTVPQGSAGSTTGRAV